MPLKYHHKIALDEHTRYNEKNPPKFA
ncbi:uncharacterized protein FRV6_02766 [Fusarium oxysporum]|uniref:Uncharacterized protein n=1 Tax=Fusarium oxysporum TaxID=5507 RepID=A0A2H3TA06_FUSOX|nr:uncharacterized protein FRV6_02766 [Fusarium oxysporum]